MLVCPGSIPEQRPPGDAQAPGPVASTDQPSTQPMSTLARGVAGLGAALVAVVLLLPGNVPSFRAKVVAAVHDLTLPLTLTEIIPG